MPEPYATKTGKVLTDDNIHALADEAEAGYDIRRPSPGHHLTEREREILELIAQGFSNAAIASTLYVSNRAVEKTISHILRKLDLDGLSPAYNPRVRMVLWYLGRAPSVG